MKKLFNSIRTYFAKRREMKIREAIALKWSPYEFRLADAKEMADFIMMRK